LQLLFDVIKNLFNVLSSDFSLLTFIFSIKHPLAKIQVSKLLAFPVQRNLASLKGEHLVILASCVIFTCFLICWWLKYLYRNLPWV